MAVGSAPRPQAPMKKGPGVPRGPEGEGGFFRKALDRIRPGGEKRKEPSPIQAAATARAEKDFAAAQDPAPVLGALATGEYSAGTAASAEQSSREVSSGPVDQPRQKTGVEMMREQREREAREAAEAERKARGEPADSAAATPDVSSLSSSVSVEPAPIAPPGPIQTVSSWKQDKIGEHGSVPAGKEAAFEEVAAGMRRRGMSEEQIATARDGYMSRGKEARGDTTGQAWAEDNPDARAAALSSATAVAREHGSMFGAEAGPPQVFTGPHVWESPGGDAGVGDQRPLTIGDVQQMQEVGREMVIDGDAVGTKASEKPIVPSGVSAQEEISPLEAARQSLLAGVSSEAAGRAASASVSESMSPADTRAALTSFVAQHLPTGEPVVGAGTPREDSYSFTGPDLPFASGLTGEPVVDAAGPVSVQPGVVGGQAGVVDSGVPIQTNEAWKQGLVDKYGSVEAGLQAGAQGLAESMRRRNVPEAQIAKAVVSYLDRGQRARGELPEQQYGVWLQDKINALGSKDSGEDQADKGAGEAAVATGSGASEDNQRLGESVRVSRDALRDKLNPKKSPPWYKRTWQGIASVFRKKEPVSQTVINTPAATSEAAAVSASAKPREARVATGAQYREIAEKYPDIKGKDVADPEALKGARSQMGAEKADVKVKADRERELDTFLEQHPDFPIEQHPDPVGLRAAQERRKQRIEEAAAAEAPAADAATAETGQATGQAVSEAGQGSTEASGTQMAVELPPAQVVEATAEASVGAPMGDAAAVAVETGTNGQVRPEDAAAARTETGTERQGVQERLLAEVQALRAEVTELRQARAEQRQGNALAEVQTQFVQMLLNNPDLLIQLAQHMKGQQEAAPKEKNQLLEFLKMLMMLFAAGNGVVEEVKTQQRAA